MGIIVFGFILIFSFSILSIFISCSKYKIKVSKDCILVSFRNSVIESLVVGTFVALISSVILSFCDTGFECVGTKSINKVGAIAYTDDKYIVTYTEQGNEGTFTSVVCSDLEVIKSDSKNKILESYEKERTPYDMIYSLGSRLFTFNSSKVVLYLPENEYTEALSMLSATVNV